MSGISDGEIHEVPWPFYRRKTELLDEEGFSTIETWVPGIVYEPIGPEESGAVAKGEGFAIYRIVSLHKPAHYPLRVFYVRQFRDPDGKIFGKRNLKVMTAQAFKRRLNGFLAQYEIDPDMDVVGS